MNNNKLLLGVAGGVIGLVILIGGGMWLASRLGKPSGNAVAATEAKVENVKYADNDTLVSENIANRIAKVEPDKLIFDGNVNVSDLPVGKPLLFPQKAVRRIREVIRENGKTVILTDKANLNEVITDGEFNWNQTFSFSKMGRSDLEKIRPYFGGVALAQSGESSDGSGVSFTGEINEWNVTVEITPNSAENRLNVMIEATKGGTARSRIRAEGFISDFRSQGGLAYGGGELENFNYQEEGLQGRLHVIFAAVELGADEALFNIPAEIGIPYTVGPIYMEAKLKANLRVVPEVRGGASAQADFTVNYSGSRGFTFEGGRVTSMGDLNDQDVAVTGETVSAGMIATGMGVGIEFPRLELAMMGETVVPYLSLDNYTYTVYTPDPPCQEGGMRQRAVVGLTLGFLGFEYNRESEIWKRERITELPNSHCGPRN
ncbi:hypothetical protein M0Q28_04735 [Patescibacteria group bacterium]|jgi:hypothetical protein|nr:hypothetical protein [Patescibacteria group bacterium]